MKDLQFFINVFLLYRPNKNGLFLQPWKIYVFMLLSFLSYALNLLNLFKSFNLNYKIYFNTHILKNFLVSSLKLRNPKYNYFKDHYFTILIFYTNLYLMNIFKQNKWSFWTKFKILNSRILFKITKKEVKKNLHQVYWTYKIK